MQSCRNFVLGAHHPRRWRRLSRFGAPHHRLRWRELVLRGLLQRPACGHRLAGVGQFRDRLEDYVPLGRAGCKEGGLHEQPPRAGAPFLSVDFPRLGDDMKALHLLSFEPGHCGREENPRNLR